MSIRQFQEFGNKQQLFLIEQEDAPRIPELKTYSCFGISIHFLVQNVVNESKKGKIVDGYGHLIREAIRSRADNIRDELFPEYYMGIHGIIISNNAVRLILNEVDTKL